MKTALIVYNPEKADARKISGKIKLLLGKNGIKSTICSLKAQFPHADFCIALGGDGTILNTGRRLSSSGTPILGLNLGSLGFLADFSYKDLVKFIPMIAAGRFSIEKRIMLNMELARAGGKKKYRSTGVNDCIIHVGQSLRVAGFRVKVNNSFLADYMGDGIVIATPTGSTAYSLAAQGPIVYPTLPVFTITPICPHTLSQRSIIVSAEDAITIEIIRHKYVNTSMLSVDGQDTYRLNIGDTIKITKSPHFLLLVRHPRHDYYDILQDKLNWGKR